MGKNVGKSRNLANFDPPPQILFVGGEPQNSETSFRYFFSGTIASKILDYAPDPKGLGKNFAPPPKKEKLGGAQGVHKLDIMTHYHL